MGNNRQIVLVLFLVFLLPLASASVILSGPEHLDVCACSSVENKIQAVNIGPQDTALVQVDGTASPWAVYAPAVLKLDPDEIEHVYTFLTVPCDAEGDYILETKVTSTFGEPQALGQGISVSSCSTLTMSGKQDATASCDCGPVQYEIVLKNTGTYEETYSLSLDTFEDSAVFSEQALPLQAGEERAVYINIRPPCAKPGRYHFTLDAFAIKTQTHNKLALQLASGLCPSTLFTPGSYVIEDGKQVFASSSGAYTVCAGAPFTIPFLLNNIASYTNVYTLTSTFDPWVVLPARTVQIGPSSNGLVDISVRAPKPGVFTGKISAKSLRDDVLLESPVTIKAITCEELSLAINQKDIKIDYQPRSLALTLGNKGRQSRNVSLLTNLPWVSFAPSQVTLDPGTQQSVTVVFSPTGQTAEGNYNFVVSALSDDQSVSQSIQATIKLRKSQGSRYLVADFLSANWWWMLLLFLLFVAFLYYLATMPLPDKEDELEAKRKEKEAAKEKARAERERKKAEKEKEREFKRAEKAAGKDKAGRPFWVIPIVLILVLVIVALGLYLIKLLGAESSSGVIVFLSEYFSTLMIMIGSLILLLVLIIIFLFIRSKRKLMGKEKEEKQPVPLISLFKEKKLAALERFKDFRKILFILFVVILLGWVIFMIVDQTQGTAEEGEGIPAYQYVILAVLIIVILLLAYFIRKRKQDGESAQRKKEEKQAGKRQFPWVLLLMWIVVFALIVSQYPYHYWDSIENTWYINNIFPYLLSIIIGVVLLALFITILWIAKRKSMGDEEIVQEAKDALKDKDKKKDETAQEEYETKRSFILGMVGVLLLFLFFTSLIYFLITYALYVIAYIVTGFALLLILVLIVRWIRGRKYSSSITWEEITSRKPGVLLLEKGCAAELIIIPKEKAFGVSAEVGQINNPSLLPPAEHVYDYFSVSLENLSRNKLKEAKIRVRVEKRWLDKHGLADDDMMFFTNGVQEWKSNDLLRIGSDDTLVYYESPLVPPGEYAVGAGEKEKEEEREEKKRWWVIPLIVLVLLLIGTIGYYLVPKVPANDNYPVIIQNFTAQVWEKNTPHTIDLTTHFFDADYDPLSFTHSKPKHISVDVSGGIVTLQPEKNWEGTDYIVFNADDGRGGIISSETVMLEVRGGEDLPVLGPEGITGFLDFLGKRLADYYAYIVVGVVIIVLLLIFFRYRKGIVEFFLEEEGKEDNQK
ncbi:hypothetical protein J4460_01925 [Candidatus Woesearchaeota archaeon]|nr:MAG: hypothetical protein QS99_C0003G0061 [archaeon GW2011_AR4]MBS3129409.1 hypothetical protein [Candidatus Woesearchaeota archaeon]HIH38451.1 hypothetical protein [Candidatus Woesearchaeota archaeon]HIJ03464.1 hypothetical protein [Candidatus Woesearchaeota archaeon]